MLEKLKSERAEWIAAPSWRKWGLVAIALFGAVYLGWSIFAAKPPKPGTVIAATTSPAVAKMERKPVAVKRIMVFTPKAQAVANLHLPPEQSANPKEEVFEATDAPPTHYGSTTVTFANVSTGMPRSVIVVKEAPWFAFERGNVIGIEYGIGSRGKYFQGDYQRDICQVKGVYLTGKGSATRYTTETDWRIGARGEYRW